MPQSNTRGKTTVEAHTQTDWHRAMQQVVEGLATQNARIRALYREGYLSGNAAVKRPRTATDEPGGAGYVGGPLVPPR